MKWKNDLNQTVAEMFLDQNYILYIYYLYSINNVLKM